MVPTALIIDDDPPYARSLSRLVQREGLTVELAFSGEEGLERLTEVHADLVLVDMALPGIDGVEVLRRLREREPQTVCIAISAHATVDGAVAAMHAGAFDFITKTTPLEELQFKLRKGLEVAELRRSVQFFRDEAQRNNPSAMVGDSAAMRRVYTQIEEIAATPTTTVLILGETGTGKELVARAVHRQSGRNNFPLVPVNCTTLPDNLMESEFFGHERGAFTGADRAKQGLVELADRGSLFLDEIGDLDQSLQGKLLRVIEERCFKRVGGVKDIEVDVRFMAATNRDLEAMTADGRFRSDLLYRLNVFPIVLPPLRGRDQDVLLLARHFVNQFNAQLGKEVVGLDDDAERLLLTHPFPGNVRQLRNLIEQAMIVAKGERLTVAMLRGANGGTSTGYSPRNGALHDPRGTAAAAVATQSAAATTQSTAATQSAAAATQSAAATAQSAPPEGDGASRATVAMPLLSTIQLPLAAQLATLRQREQVLVEEERDIIQRALQMAHGNKSQAANVLGISRYALQRRLRRFEQHHDAALDREPPPPPPPPARH